MWCGGEMWLCGRVECGCGAVCTPVSGFSAVVTLISSLQNSPLLPHRNTNATARQRKYTFQQRQKYKLQYLASKEKKHLLEGSNEMLLQCLQSSRSHIGGSNLDYCVEEKFQMTLNPWTGRSQLLPETFKFELRPVWWAAGTE